VEPPTTVPETTTSTISTSATNGTLAENSSTAGTADEIERDDNTMAIAIGAGAGGGALLLLICGLVAFCLVRRNKNKEQIAPAPKSDVPLTDYASGVLALATNSGGMVASAGGSMKSASSAFSQGYGAAPVSLYGDLEISPDTSAASLPDSASAGQLPAFGTDFSPIMVSARD